MRITITGGSGFIGTELSKFLLEKKYKIVIADIREPRIEELKEYFTFCDVTDPYQVEDVVKRSKLVFHLAANPNPGLAEKNPRWDMRINVEGTMNVIHACLRNNSRMVFTSSAAVKYAPYSCYAISKRTAEKYVLHYVKKEGLNASITRFWNVYGPTQKLGFVIPDFIEKLRRNQHAIFIRGTGFDLRDFVYIDDIIRALWLVGRKGEPGVIYEVGTGNQYTIIELAKMIGKIMNNREPKVYPSKEIREWDRREIKEDLENIYKLGWKPTVSLEEGLKRVIEARRK